MFKWNYLYFSVFSIFKNNILFRFLVLLWHHKMSWDSISHFLKECIKLVVIFHNFLIKLISKAIWTSRLLKTLYYKLKFYNKCIAVIKTIHIFYLCLCPCWQIMFSRCFNYVSRCMYITSTLLNILAWTMLYYIFNICKICRDVLRYFLILIVSFLSFLSLSLGVY